MLLNDRELQRGRSLHWELRREEQTSTWDATCVAALPAGSAPFFSSFSREINPNIEKIDSSTRRGETSQPGGNTTEMKSAVPCTRDSDEHEVLIFWGRFKGCAVCCSLWRLASCFCAQHSGRRRLDARSLTFVVCLPGLIKQTLTAAGMSSPTTGSIASDLRRRLREVAAVRADCSPGVSRLCLALFRCKLRWVTPCAEATCQSKPPLCPCASSLPVLHIR